MISPLLRLDLTPSFDCPQFWTWSCHLMILFRFYTPEPVPSWWEVYFIHFQRLAYYGIWSFGSGVHLIPSWYPSIQPRLTASIRDLVLHDYKYGLSSFDIHSLIDLGWGLRWIAPAHGPGTSGRLSFKISQGHIQLRGPPYIHPPENILSIC